MKKSHAMKATAAMKATSMKMATTVILASFINKLRALRGPVESYSDVILRLVDLEARGEFAQVVPVLFVCVVAQVLASSKYCSNRLRSGSGAPVEPSDMIGVAT